LSLAISDLNTKVKDCENEKLSLVTAIKIIQADNQHAMNSKGIWQTQKDKRRTKQVTDNIHPDRREIETTNKYTVLSDTDGESEDNDSSNAHQNATVVDPLAKPSGKSLKKRTDKHRSPSRKSSEVKSHPSNTDHPRNTDTRNTVYPENINHIRNTEHPRNSKHDHESTKTPARSKSKVVILGDSMIKHLNPRQLQNGVNHKIAIKTFPGAGIDDMVHYVKPTLSTRPDP
jgi:hypothetical protein